MRRNFNQSERIALYLIADAHCQGCGIELDEHFHADHIHPFSKGGETILENGQALCPVCNLRKGNKMEANIKYRDWQLECLDRFDNHKSKWFTVVATPGSGKTLAMLKMAHKNWFDGRIDFIICVVPTTTLIQQWADKAYNSFGLRLKTNSVWHASSKDYEGIVTTYQYLAQNGQDVVRRWAASRKVFAILDEPHHMAVDKSWGTSATESMRRVYKGVMGTGTPFRSDDYPIPFVEYAKSEIVKDGLTIEIGNLVPDYQYTYEDALSDKTVRAIYFMPTDSSTKWMDDLTTDQIPEIFESESFEEDLNIRRTSYRLRTAIDVGTQFTTDALKTSHEHLMRIRANEQPNAKSLVICKNVAHAQAVADLYFKVNGVEPVIVSSNKEHGNHKTIAEFARNDNPVILAVDMVSEGIDIPPLRVLVYLTNKTAPLYFYQSIGRIVRVEKGRELANGYVYMPADSRLVELASTIREQRTHVIETKKLCRSCEQDPCICPKPFGPGGNDPRYFEPVMATHADSRGLYAGDESSLINPYTTGELQNAIQLIENNDIRISTEECAKLLRLFGDGSGGMVITQPEDSNATEERLKRQIQRRAYRLSKKWGCEVSEVHTSWVKDFGGKWASDVTTSNGDRKEKLDWIEREIARTGSV